MHTLQNNINCDNLCFFYSCTDIKSVFQSLPLSNNGTGCYNKGVSGNISRYLISLFRCIAITVDKIGISTCKSHVLNAVQNSFLPF